MTSGDVYAATSAVLTLTRADIYSNTVNSSGGGLTLDTAMGSVLTSAVRGNRVLSNTTAATAGSTPVRRRPSRRQ